MEPASFFRTRDQLILASGSPRRQAFLRELGLVFDVEVPAVAEVPLPAEAPEDLVRRLALDKAGAVSRCFPRAWVLAADTVVVLDNDILGKPHSPAAAGRMLMRLAGRSHRVLTGFCLRCVDRAETVSRAVTTEVCFASFSEEIAAAYVNTGEPLDKAGGYGIQGRGGLLVERITGSYSNVVGLPLAEVVSELLRFGVIAPGNSE